MSTQVETPHEQSSLRVLRVWPAVLLIVAALILRVIHLFWENGPSGLWMASAFGPLLCSVLALLWWLLLSRSSAKERICGLISIVAIVAASIFAGHPSMVSPGSIVITIPLCMAAFCLGAIVFSRMLSVKRTVIALLLATIGASFSTLLKSDGMWGDFAMQLQWRWEESAEEKMLSEKANATSIAIEDAESDIASALSNPEWPAFRGADRLGRQRGTIFSSDWSTDSPEELWRISVGPAWSSFLVAGNLLFTQEQRDKQELVTCYDATTGQEIWASGIESRFFEALGGLGPRSTPTLHNGAIYALGASGDLLKLDAQSGEIVWQKNIKTAANRQQDPMWGFSSSPLVVGTTVIIHAGGELNKETKIAAKGTIAYSTESGDVVWTAPSGFHSYSSPQLCTVDGADYVLMLSDFGIELIDPATGDVQLAYEWQHSGYRALQPQVIDGNTIILPTGMGRGTRRIRIEQEDDKLVAKKMWESMSLKPDFNDFVVFENHIYGFDGLIFTCIDIADGKRKWKRGRYGKGQVLLLEDSGLLLVATEKGAAVLLKADPAKHQELAKLAALDGKTWNHPVVVGDRLYMRNANEAVCYRLPVVASADLQAKNSSANNNPTTGNDSEIDD